MSLYDELAERVCSECAAQTDTCDPGVNGEKGCFFSGDFDEVFEACERAEELIKGLIHRASNYNKHDYAYAD